MSVKHEEKNKTEEEDPTAQGSIPRAILRKTGRNWAKFGILLLCSVAGNRYYLPFRGFAQLRKQVFLTLCRERVKFFCCILRLYFANSVIEDASCPESARSG